MIAPTGFTEWGPLGAVVFLAVCFLVFIIRRDKEWRDFFREFRTIDGKNVERLTTVIDKLVERVENLETKITERVGSLETKFDQHDAKEMEFIRTVNEPKSQPRRSAK